MAKGFSIKQQVRQILYESQKVGLWAETERINKNYNKNDNFNTF